MSINRPQNDRLEEENPAPITLEPTEENSPFQIAFFTDKDGNICTIQDSSALNHDHIWLGAIKGPTKEGEKEISSESDFQAWLEKIEYRIEEKIMRMLLSQETVSSVLPHLKHFIDTGKIEQDLRFNDYNYHVWSIELDSSGAEPTLRIGITKVYHQPRDRRKYFEDWDGIKMNISKNHVASLVTHLERFVEKGSLGENKPRI
ncbi:hypothetical protein JKY72_05780 [Candidatus Gracilibacteria bacterium]|nr:hypothetical protein [Candidatus Gracilibacteria bacterium]